jgi:hypothetical protein
LATRELTTSNDATTARSRLRLRLSRTESKRATSRAEELAALAIGAAGGAVVGVGIVFLIAWLVA